MSTLKKQLEEKEQQYLEEISNGKAASERLKELRAEYNKEKSRINQLEGTFRDSLSKKQSEITALQFSLNRQHEQYTAETTNMQNKLQQVG